jgi:hypothetical protein
MDARPSLASVHRPGAHGSQSTSHPADSGQSSPSERRQRSGIGASATVLVLSNEISTGPSGHGSASTSSAYSRRYSGPGLTSQGFSASASTR